IAYTYDAAGTRLSKKVTPTSGTLVTTDYVNGFQYENNVLQFFPHAEGYVKRNTNNTYLYVYQYKDHLGNIRLSYADVNGNGNIEPASEILEENNYYPFGLNHKGYNQVVNSNRSEQAEKYKFQGQELQDELGLYWYSFKWRNYMPDLGRFFSIDPLATDYHWMTPYQFSSNQVTHAPEIEGLESGADFSVNLKVAEQLAKRDNSDIVDNYRMVQKSNELPIPDQVSVMVLRYATPVEDVFGLITGRDLEGNSYNRAEAGVWAVDSFVQFSKIVKAGKVIKIGNKQFDNLDDFYKATSKLDVGERVSVYKKVGSEIAAQNRWSRNKNLSKKNNRDIFTDSK